MPRSFLSDLRGAAFVLLTLLGSAAAAERPDMLIYLADDHSRRDCSVYEGGLMETPHLEALAADGMTFSNAFVASPTCAPSRAALLTGLMPARNGAEENHSFPREDVTKLPTVLRSLGYEVAAFGKVAHGRSAKDYGFDTFNLAKDLKPLRKNVTEYLRNRTSDKPLCLFVGISNPHVGWPEETSYDPAEITLPATFLDTPQTRVQRARYQQEVKELDAFLGELRRLAAEHLRPDPLVAYTSDHGAQWPFGKFTLYDDGVRVPLIVSWPGRVAAGTTSEALVSWVDLLPTLIELAGGEAPAGLDGYSFADLLVASEPPLGDVHRAAIFTTHSGDREFNVYPTRSIRTPRWKYIRNLHPEYAFTTHIDLLVRKTSGDYWLEWVERAQTDPAAAGVVRRHYDRPAEELYDLETDPLEQHNLLADPVGPAAAGVRDDLSLRLSAWMKRQGDEQTVFNEPRLLTEPDRWRPGLLAKPAP
ncbi:sulfatase [Alienimonas sp. DA493]|uniref:sulfatase family protein n=1 Tax=Alienimonas sp. DA493 TaxID=3373605 RepID=UPI0037542EAE